MRIVFALVWPSELRMQGWGLARERQGRGFVLPSVPLVLPEARIIKSELIFHRLRIRREDQVLSCWQ